MVLESYACSDLDQFDLSQREIRNAPHMSFVRLTCVADVIADEIVQLWIYGRGAMLQQCENAAGLSGFKYAVSSNACCCAGGWAMRAGARCQRS